MVYKLCDERGNSVYTNKEELAMKIFMEYSNCFNILEIVEDDNQEVINSMEEFNNYFY